MCGRDLQVHCVGEESAWLPSAGWRTVMGVG
jgi:hypothetical protein